MLPSKNSHNAKASFQVQRQEALALIEHKRASKEKEALTSYMERLHLIEKDHENEQQANQQLFETTRLDIKSRSNVRLDSWLLYLNAEEKNKKDEHNNKELYLKTQMNLEANYKIAIKENERLFDNTILKIEDDFHQELLTENKAYQSAMRHRTDQMDLISDRAAQILHHLQENYESINHTHLKLTLDSLHAHAVKARNTADLTLANAFKTSCLESYRMMASAIGLSGVTEDVDKYVSVESPYNAIQPLVTYNDLISALEAERDNSILSDFMKTHNLFKVEREIFLRLIESDNNFRTNVHKTMAMYNQALAHKNGWDNMPLTKRHLYRTGADASALDQTPWGIAKKEHSKLVSLISSNYYAQHAQLKKEDEDVITDASLAHANELNAIRERSAQSLEKIESDTEWEILAAEITAQSEAFFYYLHPQSFVSIAEQPSFSPTTSQKFFSNKKIRTRLHHNLPIIYEGDEDGEICSILFKN